MLDVIKANEEMVGKINPRYDLKMSQMNDLLDTYENPVNLMIAAFRFGYLQGGKAEALKIKGLKTGYRYKIIEMIENTQDENFLKLVHGFVKKALRERAK